MIKKTFDDCVIKKRDNSAGKIRYQKYKLIGCLHTQSTYMTEPTAKPSLSKQKRVSLNRWWKSCRNNCTHGNRTTHDTITRDTQVNTFDDCVIKKRDNNAGKIRYQKYKLIGCLHTQSTYMTEPTAKPSLSKQKRNCS